MSRSVEAGKSFRAQRARARASRPGRVYSRGELLELLRDYEALDQDEKTINVHVSHLREKIEDDPAQPGRLTLIAEDFGA